VLRSTGDANGMPDAATSPTDLPKDSWGATLKRTLTEFKEDKLNHWAAALTYYAVLSLFPALIVLVSLAGIVASPQTVTTFLTDTIAAIGPDSAVETFKGPIESVTSSSGTAGIMAIVGVVSALWSASGYVGAFTEASNSIYEVEEGRPVWKKKPLQLLVTFVCIMLVAITALALVLTGPLAKAVGDAIGLGDTAVTIWQYGKWPVLLGLVVLILHVLYYASPNAKVGVKWVSGGTLITLIVWLIASALFALYVSMFGSYNKTYGSLAGVVVFLLWLWITNIAVLFGVEFNAETERTRELHAGKPEAEQELKLPERERPSPKQRASTA
jgi:membrane protein